ncbi:hypothetical protein GCM10017778_31080 [Streptomyces vinaceus]|nr:hypothetical protein GCM10017778_31080 [Streptomyces vinaceus]
MTADCWNRYGSPDACTCTTGPSPKPPHDPHGARYACPGLLCGTLGTATTRTQDRLEVSVEEEGAASVPAAAAEPPGAFLVPDEPVRREAGQGAAYAAGCLGGQGSAGGPPGVGEDPVGDTVSPLRSGEL